MPTYHPMMFWTDEALSMGCSAAWLPRGCRSQVFCTTSTHHEKRHGVSTGYSQALISVHQTVLSEELCIMRKKCYSCSSQL